MALILTMTVLQAAKAILFRSNGRAMLCTGLRSATLFGFAKSCRALQTIYNFNVTKVRCGRYGAVNGMCLDGCVDETLLQSHEIWRCYICIVCSYDLRGHA
jgi:hypothetical protein